MTINAWPAMARTGLTCPLEGLSQVCICRLVKISIKGSTFLQKIPSKRSLHEECALSQKQHTNLRLAHLHHHHLSDQNNNHRLMAATKTMQPRFSCLCEDQAGKLNHDTKMSSATGTITCPYDREKAVYVSALPDAFAP